MTEQEIEQIVISGRLPDKIRDIHCQLMAISSHLRKKGLIMDGVDAMEVILAAGKVCRGFDDENPLHMSEVKEYLENEDLFVANEFGVTVDHYKKYKAFKSTRYKCSAKTKNGKPCKSWMFSGSELPKSPAEFNPSRRYFCSVHEKAGEF